MITLQEPLIDISMRIEIDLPQSKILEFLAKKGYNIEAYRQYYPPVDEMLTSSKEWVNYTFVAVKENETPDESNLYLKVFEKEIKALLNNL